MAELKLPGGYPGPRIREMNANEVFYRQARAVTTWFAGHDMSDPSNKGFAESMSKFIDAVKAYEDAKILVDYRKNTVLMTLGQAFKKVLNLGNDVSNKLVLKTVSRVPKPSRVQGPTASTAASDNNDDYSWSAWVGGLSRTAEDDGQKVWPITNSIGSEEMSKDD